MATNLLELAQSYITGPVTRQISGLLGEGEAATHSAINAAMPSLLGGLIKQASTPGGTSGLAASLDRLDTGFLGNLGASLGGGGAQRLMDTGAGLVKNLFGGSVDAVSGVIGRTAGVGKGAMSSLLGLMAPIVMGVIAKMKKTQNLDADGLQHLLVDQKAFVANALPTGVKDALGLGNVLESAADTGRAAFASAGHQTAEAGRAAYDAGRAAWESTRSAVSSGTRGTIETVERRSSIGRYWPLLLIPIIALLAWRLFSTANRTTVPAAQAAASQLENAKQQVTNTFQSVTTALNGVKDEATARTALPVLETAGRSITALTGSVAAMPQSVRDGVSQLVRNLLPGLQSLVGNVQAIPGVSNILGPALTPLMNGLTRLGG